MKSKLNINTTTAPTGQIAPFGLRMLPELREKVEAAARESGRSMNAEIVARIKGSFGPNPQSHDQVKLVEQVIAALQERGLVIAQERKGEDL